MAPSFSPALTLPIPPIDQLPSGMTAAARCRHALGRGLAVVLDANGNCRPATEIQPVDYSDWPVGKMVIGTIQIGKMEFLRKEWELPMRAVFARIVMLGLDLIRQDEKTANSNAKPSAREIPLPFTPWCPEQQTYFAGVMNGLAAQKVVFAEGSTGIGKGRALVAAAVAQVKAGKRPVVIAAPTVNLVGALYAQEYKALPDAYRAGIRATVLPGASEFIDSDKLLSDLPEIFQTAPDYAEGVREWLRSGGLARSDSPLVVALRDMGITPAWLARDLAEAVPGFPVEAYQLDPSEKHPEASPHKDAAGTPDSGWSALRMVRAACMQDPDIVFVTHAMLAVNHKIGWKLFPAPDVLILDEAQLYEQAVSNVRSMSLSLLTLRSVLARSAAGGRRGAKTALKRARDLTAILQSMNVNSDTVTIAGGAQSSPARPLVADAISGILQFLSEKVTDEEPNLRRERSILVGIQSTLKGASPSGAGGGEGGGESNRHRVDVIFSPDRRFPSIRSGITSLRYPLQSLWKTVEGGVVLASATLFTTNALGERRCDYMRNVLAVPNERAATPPPVIASHIYSLPTLHVPTKGTAKRLFPPQNDGAAGEAGPAMVAWCDVVADGCLIATGPARGGTLVLCTSYEQIKTLALSLEAKGLPAERMVVAKRGRAFRSLEIEYRRLYKAGGRPVMLALGPAWTGLSLTDADASPAEDFMLTDVIVTRVPVSVNKTLSMETRMEKLGVVYPLAQEALLTFKQGLGRLIRRSGVTDRNLWVLDGRIWISPGFRLRDLSDSCVRLLSDYKNRATYRIEAH